MLHKVTVGYFRLFEDGRKRPAFQTFFVEAETGDEAADAAMVAASGRLIDQAPDTRVGVHGVDVPTVEEVAAHIRPARPVPMEAADDSHPGPSIAVEAHAPKKPKRRGRPRKEATE